tara:strand:+ start:167 stop:982 length:816 start_codon:yes stop_codon:yes gene_type:complete
VIKFVISDYNWLDKDFSKAWFSELTSDYIIYDKFHRFEESNKVIRQKNVGQNVYDMFDFIVNNYENLPEKIFFCRSCITFPKGRPKPNSNGNCSLEEIKRLLNKDGLVEINDYYRLEVYKLLSEKLKYIKEKDEFIVNPNYKLNFHDQIRFSLNRLPKIFREKSFPYSFCTEQDGYLEINSNWYFRYHKSKFFNSYNNFMSTFFRNYVPKKYLRFSPGCSYIVPSENIRRYRKDLYIKLRSLVDYAPVIGESHMLERALFTIFEGELDAIY